MHISPFIAYIPDLSKTGFDDTFYQAMRDDFNQLFDEGLFRQVSEIPYYYIVEIKNKDTTSTGLAAMTSIQDYADSYILKHEQTISKKEKLHHTLLASRKAMIKPVALLMPPLAVLESYLDEVKKHTRPVLRLRFPDVFTTQKVWKIDSPDWTKKITSLFEKRIHHVVIADGHHRFSTLARMHTLRKPVSILSVFFSPDQMEVSTFYRIVKKKKKQSYQSLLDKLKAHTIAWKKTNKVTAGSSFIYLVLRQDIFRFKLKMNPRHPIPLSFSQDILGPVFDVFQETKSKRVSYIEAPEDLATYQQIIDQHQDAFIFILPSLTTQQILHNKKILPPKSTLFSPRIINGLIVATI